MDMLSPLLDFMKHIKLVLQHRGKKFGEDEAAPFADPRILIDFAAEKVRTVGSLLTDDFSASGEVLVVCEKCSPFSAHVIFRVVETVASHLTDRTKIFSFVCCI